MKEHYIKEIIRNMVKINNIDLIGMFFGMVMSVSAWARFIIHGSDLGETALAVILGATIVCVFWIHNNQSKIATTQYDIECYLADMNKK